MRLAPVIILSAAAAAAVACYLLVSQNAAGLGFPLDDAWIHQVYARNLAETGRWRFGQVESAGGSTGPLWGFLLAGGYLTGIDPRWAAYGMGGALLALNAWAGMVYARRLNQAEPRLYLAVGWMIVLDYHLVWAAGSGMETLLFSLISLVVLAGLASPGKTHWAWVGLWIGVSVWVRPGGITLLGPAVLAALMQEGGEPGSWKRSWKLLPTFLLVFILYLTFNDRMAGEFWPNTFYAKQEEYAVLQEISLGRRYLDVAMMPFIGAAAALLPGLIVAVVQSVSRKEWRIWPGLLWALGYIGLYAWRLPVTYQHGRYLMPVIPVFIVLGLLGAKAAVNALQADRWRFVLAHFWELSLLILVVAFFVLGARAYAADVGVIETEMVRAAHWIDRNLEHEEVIAAHDIGALGYFTENRIVDLAGLVSPEVIPIMRDERELALFLDAKEVDFLVAFPSWYPVLTESLEEVYRTEGKFAPALGHENLAVFSWPRSRGGDCCSQ